MSSISELIEKDRIEKLLQKFSETFHSPVFLFDKDKKLLFKFPAEASDEHLTEESLCLRDLVIGYVAIPDGTAGLASLKFIAENLSWIAEMGYEIENLAGEVAKNYDELSLIWKLSSRLEARLNAENICSVLAEEVMCTCPSNNILVLLISETEELSPVCYIRDNEEVNISRNKKTYFCAKAFMGHDADKAAMMVLSTDKGLLGHVYAKKEPVTVRDVNKDSRFEGLPYPVTSILIVPLMVEGLVIGAIIVSDKLNGEEFFNPEIRLIHNIALECAIAIKKALLIEEIRLNEKALRASDEQLRILSSYLLVAQETERKRISLELHDDLGQALLFLKLRLRFIKNSLSDDQILLLEECSDSMQTIDRLIDNIRKLSRDLSPAILEDLGLTAALNRLIKDFARYHDTIEISVTMPDIDSYFTKMDKIFIYRIFQESLTNISKHSQARHVSIMVSHQDEDSILFRIEDDGRGFDIEKVLEAKSTERGLGIAALRQRVQTLCGHFSIIGHEGKGTQIEFSIPWKGKEKNGPVQDCPGR